MLIKKISGDTQTPIVLYKKIVGNDKGFLLESSENGEFSFIGIGEYEIKGKKDEIIINDKYETYKKTGVLLESIKEFINNNKCENTSELPFVGGIVGYIAYDIIKQYENIETINPDNINIPDIHMFIVRNLVIYDHKHSTIYLVSIDDDQEFIHNTSLIIDVDISFSSIEPHKYRPFVKVERLTEKDDYIKKVEKAKEYIENGDIFQVVISQRVKVEIKERGFDIYRRLRMINPSAYLYYFNFGEYELIGSSPELLVKNIEGEITTCPIAGTRKIGTNKEENIQIANDLLKDEKEKAEHNMLVDLARNDLGRVAKINSISLEEYMKVKFYSHVMHIVSTVKGELKEDMNNFDIISSFIPAGTLSGAPKIRAMEIIEELEDYYRGFYGGATGYFCFSGNMDFCITIRTLLKKGDDVYLQAGGGVVLDSNPENEYEECFNKLRALIKTLGGNV